MPTENRSSNTEMVSVPRLLAADNDRDMLEYLSEGYASQVYVCEQCGHEEPLKTYDLASDLQDYLAAYPDVPAQQHLGDAIGTLVRDYNERIVFTPIGDPHIIDDMKVYTHADPVEVERLRDALRLAKHWCDAALNAIQMGSGNPDALNDVACLLRHMAKDLDSTAPASAEPSAPVEIDDRAGFEAYALDKGWLSQHLKQRPDGNYEDWGVNPEWQAWKARAALERKPQVKS